MKSCRVCNIKKSLESFYSYSNKCRKCVAESNGNKDESLRSFNGEYWKEFIPNYLVSNFGRVFRLSHVSKNRKHAKMLRQLRGVKYDTFSVHGKVYYIHRAVASLFVDNPNKYNVVNHIDLNPSNNHHSNLEWCTTKENVVHSARLGRYSKKLTIDQVKEIRASGLSVIKCAEKYRISTTTVYMILSRKIWNHDRATNTKKNH